MKQILKPCAYKRWEPDPLFARERRVTACLLHYDPASCSSVARLSRSAAEPKRKRVLTGR